MPAASFLGKFEKELELPRGFFSRLGRGDDWSFFIKAHSLVDLAIANLLQVADGRKATRELYVRHLDAKRRVAFAQALELIDSHDAKLVTKLAEIRNKLAHDPREVSFSFHAHYNGLPEKGQDVLLAVFGRVPFDRKPRAHVVPKVRFEKDPKQFVWAHVVALVVKLSLQASLIEAKAKAEKSRVSRLEELEVLVRDPDFLELSLLMSKNAPKKG